MLLVVTCLPLHYLLLQLPWLDFLSYPGFPLDQVQEGHLLGGQVQGELQFNSHVQHQHQLQHQHLVLLVHLILILKQRLGLNQLGLDSQQLNQ